jgi:formylglycine-generating enzyme required for sulfatase activity
MGNAQDGCGHNGGIWEWTSTLFDHHEGMVPTKIFSGCVHCLRLRLNFADITFVSRYSSDFFDGKHHVVVSHFMLLSMLDLTRLSIQLGASYATIPRLAGRRTLRNFWQHNYPYAWVGARVVYDV